MHLLVLWQWAQPKAYPMDPARRMLAIPEKVDEGTSFLIWPCKVNKCEAMLVYFVLVVINLVTLKQNDLPAPSLNDSSMISLITS